MSLVKIKNVTSGKLVFMAVRGYDDCPLTLEAGEEKDVVPSMASQPSLRAVIGTKVVILDSGAPKVEKPQVVVAPPPVVEHVPPTYKAPPEVEVVPASEAADSAAPEESRYPKPSRNKGRR